MSYMISVIIPIYNADKYLENTINTVINQSIGFENIELILIDDNSTDNSKEIIKKYSENYKNITSVFLETNHGLPGYGRNIGIDIAKADYIMFLDNDDEYCPEICKTLYETIENTNADLVGCNFILKEYLGEYYKNAIPNSDYEDLINENINYKKDELFTIFLNQNTIYYQDPYIWTKIFKKNIIKNNNLKFITKKRNEDALFCIEYNMYANKVINLNKFYGYIHIMHGTNISTENLQNALDLIESYYSILNLIKKNKNKVNLRYMFKNRIESNILRAISINTSFKKRYNLLKQIKKFKDTINIDISYKNKLINILNQLIAKNHIFTTTILVYFLNIIYNNKTVLKTYRKLFGVKKVKNVKK